MPTRRCPALVLLVLAAGSLLAAPPTLEELQAEEERLTARFEATSPNARAALATARARLADAHLARHAPELAVDYLLSAVRLDPGHADRLERLGDLLGLVPAAAAPALRASCYGDAAALAPTTPGLRAKAARAYQAAGEPEAARPHLEALVSPPGGPPDPAFLPDLVLTFLTLEDPGAGVAFLEPLVQRGAPVEFRLHLGILRRAAGDLAGARRELAAVLATPAEEELAAYARRLDQQYAALQEGATP